jgi:MerR family transcriptional regulator, light-induced transcriptional regulator
MSGALATFDDLPALSIKTVARMANLSIDTIRAWEKRYRAVVPQRANGGRRQFSGDDVERLVLLREIVAAGTAISRIAHCTTSELRNMVRVAVDRGESDDADVVRLLKAIRAHDVSLLCEELLLVTLVRSAAEFGDDIIAAVLAELERNSEARHTGELLLASALCSISSKLFEKHRTNQGATIISLTLPGEQHAIPPLLAALVAAESGFTGMYVGTQIEPADIETLAVDLNAAGIVIHTGVESYEHMQAALRLLEKLPRTRVVITGRGGILAPPGSIAVTSLRELANEFTTGY